MEGKLKFKSLIQKQLLKAFNLAGDLKVSATFNKKLDSGFDFGSAEPMLSSLSSVTVEVVDIKTSKSYGEKATITKELLAVSSQIGSLSAYDSILLSNEQWFIGDVLTDDGYITMFKVYRHG